MMIPQLSVVDLHLDSQNSIDSFPITEVQIIELGSNNINKICHLALPIATYHNIPKEEIIEKI